MKRPLFKRLRPLLLDIALLAGLCAALLAPAASRAPSADTSTDQAIEAPAAHLG